MINQEGQSTSYQETVDVGDPSGGTNPLDSGPTGAAFPVAGGGPGTVALISSDHPQIGEITVNGSSVGTLVYDESEASSASPLPIVTIGQSGASSASFSASGVTPASGGSADFSYLWSCVPLSAGAATASFSNDTSESPTATFTSAGNYRVHGVTAPPVPTMTSTTTRDAFEGDHCRAGTEDDHRHFRQLHCHACRRRDRRLRGLRPVRQPDERLCQRHGLDRGTIRVVRQRATFSASTRPQFSAARPTRRRPSARAMPTNSTARP